MAIREADVFERDLPVYPGHTVAPLIFLLFPIEGIEQHCRGGNTPLDRAVDLG